MTNLRYLSLAENSLQGSIPEALGELGASLEELRLHANDLTGEIPSELGKLKKLRSLSVHANMLYGEVCLVPRGPITVATQLFPVLITAMEFLSHVHAGTIAAGQSKCAAVPLGEFKQPDWQHTVAARQAQKITLLLVRGTFRRPFVTRSDPPA